jgi:glycosyltransferase involved in cell wall biosynthesis
LGIASISVIIPVRNEGDRLICTARSIVAGRSCCFPLELVVVDDSSSDGACNRLQDELAAEPETGLLIRTLASWSGIPFARNRGAEADIDRVTGGRQHLVSSQLGFADLAAISLASASLPPRAPTWHHASKALDAP